MNNAISVVICAHNSSQRISPTLAHLAQQEVPETLSWEVVLIDNGSTDGTAEIARTAWRGSVPLRVIHEPKLGLSHARERGIREATYDIISFVDDDNWLNPEWLVLVAKILAEHPEAAGCGGYIAAVYEVPPAPWFARCAQSGYAIGKQATVAAGTGTWTNGHLWGAGFSVRKSALTQLFAQGFKSYLVDRKGEEITGGGDIELCFALRHSGWKLWYDERLRLQHYMPARRLEWGYLRKLNRGMALSDVLLIPYFQAISPPPRHFLSRIGRSGLGQLILHMGEMALSLRLLIKSHLRPQVGNPDILQADRQVGRLLGLLRTFTQLEKNRTEIQNAPWFRHQPRA